MNTIIKRLSCLNLALLLTVLLTVPAAGEGEPKVLVCDWDLFGASTPVEHTWDGRKVTFTVTGDLLAKHVMIVF